MVSLGYAWEKLYVATSTMARGNGSVQSRLFDAYLSFHTLNSRPDYFLPETLQNDFEEIMSELTRVKTPVGDEGIVNATLDKMSDSDAKCLVEKIVSLYDKVTRLHAREAP